jgi:putative salt-induced outer membrane protein YdiY
MSKRSMILAAMIAASAGVAWAQETPASPEVPAVEPGLLGTEFMAGWTKQFELGLAGSGGNTDSLAFNSALTFSTDKDGYRAELGARYFLTTNDGDRNRNEVRVYGTYDKKFEGSPWFVFGRVQYDYDEFQAWENRASAFFGPGYEFVKKENYELIGRVGLGVAQDFGNDATDEFRVEALLGIDGKWKVTEGQEFTYSIYYFPSLSDFADGRTLTQLGYLIALNEAKGISLRLGLEHEYEQRTANSSDHNDWKYFVNLLVKF